MLRWLVIRRLLFGVGGALLLVCAAASCESEGWWGQVDDPRACDPSTKAALRAQSLWGRTFGGKDQMAHGCLRISWGLNREEGVGIPVRLHAEGTIFAYNPKTNKYDRSPSFSVPRSAQGKPRHFRLFVYGEDYQFLATNRINYCQKTMANPLYKCLEKSISVCWFGLAFRPRSPKPSSIKAAPIPDAGGASCKFFIHPTPQEPRSKESFVLDGGEPLLSEPLTEPPLERRETFERVCTTGEQRSCFSKPSGCRFVEGSFECKGGGKAGTQSCNSLGQWGACVGDVGPKEETCNHIDDDCNGKIDDLSKPCTYPCTAPCVDTFAGTGKTGATNGVGTQATFHSPVGAVVDSQGNLFVADKNNHSIRKITPSGIVSLFAGNGQPGTANGKGSQAQFRYPTALAIDAQDNIYVADTENHVIRLVDPQGNVGRYAGVFGKSGENNGGRLSATFNNPAGIAVDAVNVYVADTGNHILRVINRASGNVSTLAGNSSLPGSTDGIGINARFQEPMGLAVDGAGNVYVADRSNHRIRKVEPNGKVSTFLGDGVQDHRDGPARNARFRFPEMLAFGPKGVLYVADTFNVRIRMYDPQTKRVTTVAGSFTNGYKDGPALRAQFESPKGIAFYPDGNLLYIVDTDNQRIRRFFPK